MKVDAATVPRDPADTGRETLLVSKAGGLTQFGAYSVTLPPSAKASDRHWHSVEDEFLLVLDGTATVIDDNGAHQLGAGDAAAWRKGDPNGHHVLNKSAAPVRYLIIGSRVVEDICTYPDSGRRQVNGKTHWQVLDASGEVLRGGTLPPELLNLSADWGIPFDPALAVQRVLPASARQWVQDGALTHPVLGTGPGPYRYSVLGDPGGLSQFGIHLEAVPPAARRRSVIGTKLRTRWS